MTSPDPIQQLCELLAQLGFRAIPPGSAIPTAGFPVDLSVADGKVLTLDLDQPGLLSSFDPEWIGAAVIDEIGFVSEAWGLARSIQALPPDTNLLETPLAELLLAAYRGSFGSIHHNGFRYFTGSVRNRDGVLVVVTNAHEEMVLAREAFKSEFDARALRKIGKALTMNQTLEPICYAAVHEITSVAELAAALLWVQTSQESGYELASSVGVNRNGTSLLKQLHGNGNVTCIAELVMFRKETLVLRHVGDHVMTSDLEAKFCYLKPGGLMILPLVIGDRLLGVLELISRDSDHNFLAHRELFETVAEHLSLAINSALMFESFERLATVDPLTGVANHRTMQEFLHRRIHEALRSEQELGVIMLDVDHFRSFNEEEGHDTGDQVLKRVVEAMKVAVRPYDLVARYGGEEFTVIMANSGAQEAMRVAERIRKKIEEIEIPTSNGRTRHVTASLGIAIFPHASAEPQGILKAADVALYEAKHSGRNRCVLFEGVLDSADMPSHELDVTPWVRDVTESDEFVSRLSPYVRHVTMELGLSRAQQTMLKNLLQLFPTYQSASKATLAKWRKASELRALLPSLEAVDERWDGTGPSGLEGERIPLLARLLGVLASLAQHPEQLHDLGRFDPELVGLVGDIQEAA